MCSHGMLTKLWGGGDLGFICHHLNVNPFVNPSITPKKQPPRRSSKDHFDAIKDEVMKLKHAGAIKEVFYPKWLPTLWLQRRKMESGGYVWTSQI